jgi:tyrosyl-tRNA synthetase
MFESLKTFMELNEEESATQIEKMSASNENTKIDLLDTKNGIKSKINKAYCFPGDAEDNSLMTILEKILFPLLEHKGKMFVINRKEKFGGPMEFKTFHEVKEAYVKEELHPGDFKLGITDTLNDIISPIREKFESKEMKQIVKLGYK